MDQQIDFSVILTCYREELSIREFHRRLTSAMQTLERSYEVVMINDGSPDGTLAEIEDIYAEDPNTQVLIDFWLNSGQAAAHTAGIAEARGQALIFIDSDLQLDPEDIPKLVAAYDEGLDMVGGCRTIRHDSAFRRVSSLLANMLIRKITGTQMRDIFCCYKIITTRIVKEFNYGPHRLFRVFEVMKRCPRCQEVDVAHHPRPYAQSGWTFFRLLLLLLDTIMISVGNPFRLLVYGGLTLLAATLVWVSLVQTGILYIDTLFHLKIIALILLGMFPAVVLIVFGVVGGYILKVRRKPSGMPLYIVRALHRKGE